MAAIHGHILSCPFIHITCKTISPQAFLNLSQQTASRIIVPHQPYFNTQSSHPAPPPSLSLHILLMTIHMASSPQKWAWHVHGSHNASPLHLPPYLPPPPPGPSPHPNHMSHINTLSTLIITYGSIHTHLAKHVTMLLHHQPTQCKKTPSYQSLHISFTPSSFYPPFCQQWILKNERQFLKYPTIFVGINLYI